MQLDIVSGNRDPLGIKWGVTIEVILTLVYVGKIFQNYLFKNGTTNQKISDLHRSFLT
jgi:hypothetical protein